MKTKHLLLLAIIAVATGCSSAYRTGQTPDDVYYSPAPPPVTEYVTSNNQQDKDSYAYNNTYNSGASGTQVGILDPGYQRSNISLGLGYGYNPYDYFGSSFYSPYSSYDNPYAYSGVTFYSHNYNSYYSPFNNYYSPYNNYYSPFGNYYSPYYNNYYPPVYISKPGDATANYSRGPRRSNMNVYNTTSNTSLSPRGARTRTTTPTTTNSAPVRTFKTQPANRSGTGNFIRRVFSPSNNNNNTRTYNNNNNNNNNNSTPSRSTQSNNSSNNNSSSSGSSGSAPVRTFRH